MALSLGCVSALCAGLVFALGVQRRCFPYLWSDIFFLLKLIRYGLKLEFSKLTSSVCTVLDRFVQQAQRIPDKPFVVYDGRIHTYRDVDRRSNRLAHIFHHTAKLKKGDCVALLMSNEPDFICVWFGLAKAGCSVAFLNTNIKSKSLLHCFSCCGATTLIVGSGKTHLLIPLSFTKPGLQLVRLQVLPVQSCQSWQPQSAAFKTGIPDSSSLAAPRSSTGKLPVSSAGFTHLLSEFIDVWRCFTTGGPE